MLRRRVAAALNADELVDAAYRAVLGREPDAEGRASWTARLRGGLPWGDFLSLLADSDEASSRRTASTEAVIDLLRDVDGEVMLRCPLPDGSVISMGGPCDEQSFVAPLLAARGRWEPMLTAWLFDTLRPGDVFLDGGANAGWFAVVAAHIGARVVAFEPGWDARTVMTVNLQRNKADAEVHGVALWDRSERRAFSVVREGLAYAHLGDASDAEDAVECVALDDMVAAGLSLRGLRVVKLDIEGAEPQSLAGMRHVLQEHRPLLAVECNAHCLRRMGNSVESLWDALVGLGYGVEVMPAPQHADLFLAPLLDRSDFAARVAAADARVAAPSDVIQLIASPLA
jgi:FkbM family methyltransferase